MTLIQFDDDHYQLLMANQSTQLLPKEYALFQFLYSHPSRTFTRDELLDAVWSMESPTDRTVDDHIYRLRKKLKLWESYLSIETIRGRGYQLKIKEPQIIKDNPLRKNEQFKTDMTNLFYTYLSYGQGHAIETLAQHEEILGIEFDQFRKLYLLFMTGNFKGILENPHASFWDKAFYLLHLYSYFHPEANLTFVERAISKQKLPLLHQQEIENYNLVTFYLDTEQVNRAKSKMKEVHEWVEKEGHTSLIPFVHVLDLQILLHQQKLDEMKKQMDQLESIFKQYPYMREKGTFYVLKGFWFLMLDNKKEAVKWIDEGIQTLEKTKFVPHKLHAIHKLVYYLRKFQLDPTLMEKFTTIWNDQLAAYQLRELEPKIEQLLRAHL